MYLKILKSTCNVSAWLVYSSKVLTSCGALAFQHRTPIPVRFPYFWLSMWSRKWEKKSRLQILESKLFRCRTASLDLVLYTSTRCGLMWQSESAPKIQSDNTWSSVSLNIAFHFEEASCVYWKKLRIWILRVNPIQFSPDVDHIVIRRNCEPNVCRDIK